VNANFFDVMQVQPARWAARFNGAKTNRAAEREVIFSDALWRNRFAAPPIFSQNHPLTIRITRDRVMPPKFVFPLALICGPPWR